MNKILSLFFVTCLTFCLSSCNDNVHKHTFSNKWDSDEENHWHSATCEHNDKKDNFGSHTFNEQNVCTICGYQKPVVPHEHTFSEGWTWDENSHWHEATCGHDEISGLANHVFDEEGNCTICDYQKPVVPHEHTFSEDWTWDDNSHWHEATCGHDEISGLANHVFDEEGNCTICNYEPEISYTVNEEEWDFCFNGSEPFGLSECSIEFSAYGGEELLGEYSIIIDGNIIKETFVEGDKITTNYIEKDDAGNIYCYFYKDEINKYVRYQEGFNQTIVKAIFSFLDTLSGYFEYFEFNSTTHKYEFDATKWETSSLKLDLAEVSFENKKIMEISSMFIRENLLYELEFSYAGEKVELPEYKIDEDLNIKLWTSYGSRLASVLNNIIENISNELTNDIRDVKFEHTNMGSYEKTFLETIYAIPPLRYPDLVTGRAQDFVEYAANSILNPLDELIEKYNQTKGTDVLNDYFPQYMIENCGYDNYEDGQPKTMSLPMSANAEAMYYNGTFVDYCETIESSLGVVPATWQEWQIKGPMYNDIFKSLKGTGKGDGLALYGKQNYEGKAFDFAVHKRDDVKDLDGNYIEGGDTGRKLLLDFTDIDLEPTQMITWDDTTSMFITLIKQWGAEFTRVDESQSLIRPDDRIGEVLFYSKENLPKVIECLKFFNDLNKKGIIGTPAQLFSNFGDEAFKNNKTMFLISYPTSFAYNAIDWNQRVRVAPLPYYSDGNIERKFVMLQQTDIALTDQTLYKADGMFEAMVKLSSGENQAKLCIEGGYIPTTKSATFSPIYQNFLTEANTGGAGLVNYMQENGCTEEDALEHAFEQPQRVLNRESSLIFNNDYMNLSKGYSLFTNPVFYNSSVLSNVIKIVFTKVFNTCESDSADEVYKEIMTETIKDPAILARPNIRIVM